MTDYEKLKLQRLHHNATRMKDAYGYNSLANKILHANCNAHSNHTVDAEMSEEDEYEPGDDEDEEGQCQAILNKKSHGKKQTLRQTLPMAKFAMLKSQKMQNLEKGKPQPPQNDQLNQRKSQVQSSKQEQQHKKRNAIQIQQLRNPKKNPQIKYCSPGSLTAFKNMRQRQQEQGRHVDNIDYELDDVEEHEDVLPEPGNDLEVESLRGGDYLISSEGNRMDNINDFEDHQPLSMENENITPSVKKHRGPTTMIEVHRRTLVEREMIVLNANGQPIGPTPLVVTKFSRFLGTVAKCPNLVPLNYISWKYVPAKDRIWEYVKERYMIHEEGKKWVLDTINALWRVHKARLKEKYFNPYETNEDRLANKLENIPINQYEELIEYWNSDLAKEISKNNKRSREMQDDVHTMGPSSYALLRYELQEKDPNKQPPSQTKIYKESRKRVPGRAYKTKNEKSMENIEKMNALQSAYEENEDGTNSKDPYCEVITNGRLHLFGRSVTKTKLKEMEKDKRPSYILPSEFLQSIKADLVQQAAPDLISLLASKIQAANPGVELIIPEITISPRDVSSATSCQPNEQPQDSMHQDERNRGSTDE